MKKLIAALIGCLICAPAAIANVTPPPPQTSQPAAATRPPPPDRPTKMSNREIAAYNQGLDARDPDYIKCRSYDVIGSLAKQTRVCKTNKQWAEAFQTGNKDARDTVEAMSRAPVSGQ